MDPQIVMILLGATLLLVAVAAVYLWNQVKVVTSKANRLADDKEGLEKRLKELRTEVGNLKPKLNKSKSEAGNRDADVKVYKKKIHDLKKEVKTLRDQHKAQAKPVSASDASSIHLLREELMEAMNDGENYRVRAEKAESELERLGDGGQQITVTEQQPKAKAEAGSQQDDLELELGATIKKYKVEIRDLKQAHRATLRSDKEKLLSEIKDLRRNNSRLGRDADEQRRRADNNDRAYKIVQLQLDASLEKLAVIDPEVHAPGGFYDPEVEERLRQEAIAKRKKREAEEAKAKAKRDDADRQKKAADALASLTEESAADATAAEITVEAAKSDEAMTDEGKADEAKADDTKADEAKADDTKAEEAKADDTKAEEAKTDEPKAEEANTDETEAKSDTPIDPMDDESDPLGLQLSGDIDEGWSLEGPDIADLLAPKKAQTAE